MPLIDKIKCNSCGECITVYRLNAPFLPRDKTPLLGNIPIDLELRQGGDARVPLMVSKPDSEVGQIFQKAAKELAEKIDKRT